MIRVAPAAEPASFEARVRRRGQDAIAELVGRTPRERRRGPKRKQVATKADAISPDAFPPYWRDALDDLLVAYERRCAFLALYLEHATGNPSVDHMLPKSRRWDRVYEWNNYRLCAATINARKRDMVDLVDPFDCRAGWFELELVGFQVIAGPKAPSGKAGIVATTLQVLNSPDCCRAREEYVTQYEAGHIDIHYLRRRAPFVACELERQGRLRVPS